MSETNQMLFRRVRQAEQERDEMRRRLEAAERVVAAQDALLVAYRLQSLKPAAKAIDELEAARAAYDAAIESEART